MIIPLKVVTGFMGSGQPKGGQDGGVVAGPVAEVLVQYLVGGQRRKAFLDRRVFYPELDGIPIVFALSSQHAEIPLETHRFFA